LFVERVRQNIAERGRVSAPDLEFHAHMIFLYEILGNRGSKHRLGDYDGVSRHP
jgi:hypothetical protein